MKYLLILLFIPIMAAGQNDVDAIIPFRDSAKMFRIYYQDTTFYRIDHIYSICFTEQTEGGKITSLCQDARTGEVIIRGDTIEAIKMMLKYYMKNDSATMSLYEFRGAAIEWTNKIPDFWKDWQNNPAWPRYKEMILKQGYKLKKLRTPPVLTKPTAL